MCVWSKCPLQVCEEVGWRKDKEAILSQSDCLLLFTDATAVGMGLVKV